LNSRFSSIFPDTAVRLKKLTANLHGSNWQSAPQSLGTMHVTAAFLLAAVLSAGCAPLSAAAPGDAGAHYALLHVLPGDVGYVNGMACTLDGSLLAVASDDGAVTIWNTASGDLVRVLRGHKSAVYSVAFSPDETTIATAGFDETIHIWELSSGRELRALVGHHGWINAVAFTANGRKLLSAGRDRTVRIWDIDSGKILRVMEYPSEIFTVAAGSDGRLFASDNENSFSIREIATGKELSSGRN
jgi:WD40 repeat protein